MNTWQEDMLNLLTEEGKSEPEVFAPIEAAALALGFEHVAYGFRAPLPVSKPKIFLVNNYPEAWRKRYAEAGYLQIDPTVLHGTKSQVPIVWSDHVFRNAPALWQEAQAFGLKVGWAQSSLDGYGVGGMLTLSRSCEPLSAEELEAKQQQMLWLVHIAHMVLSRLLRNRSGADGVDGLTCREVEILKWTADGKSAQDIADILAVSKNTVDFHIKNAVSKMHASNKTAAVVRAAMLGYLHRQ